MTDAREITELLHGSWHGNSGMAFCPGHDNTQTPALSIGTGDDGRLLLHCIAGCSFEEVIAALRDRGILSGNSTPQDHLIGEFPEPEAPHSRAQQEERARNIWIGTQEIMGTPAEAYLQSRGIKCENIRNLRYAPVCRHPSGDLLSAMVGLIEGSDGFAVHCTYLDPETGKKAAVEPQKAMFGPVKGGAVRLFQGEGGLIASEGIETCLSIQSGISPPPLSGWAALSASGMRSLRLPLTPSGLIIAVDGDEAGRQAAYDLAERAKALGWNVALAVAPDGKDWNDVLGEGAKWP